MWDNASRSSPEFLSKHEEQPFHSNPSSRLPDLEEQPFGLNPNVQQVYINHLSLPQGRPYENGPYFNGFLPLQSFPQFYPPLPPPPYGYNNPPPYQYYQDPRDYPNYIPPHNNYVNSPWGSQGNGPFPIPFRNRLPSSPLPLLSPNHIRPSVHMVKQISSNLREIPSAIDQMKNLSISCKPQGPNALQKNNNVSPTNISNQSSLADKFIEHDFQQHSNLVHIKMEDLDGPKEKSEVTTYSVDDISSEEASYEEVSEPESSSAASVLMYTLELIDIAEVSGKPLEVWMHQGEPHVILQQVAQVIMPPEGARDLVDTALDHKGPGFAHLVIQDDYVVGDMIRKIEKTGTTAYSVGISIKIICKKNLSMDEAFILLIPLGRLFDFTSYSKHIFTIPRSDFLKFIISAMKKHSKADDSDEDSDED